MRSLDIIRLTPEHLKELTEIISRGRPRTRKTLFAMALIWLDCAQNGPGLSDSYVANTLGLSLDTIGELKKLYLEGGPSYAVSGARPYGPASPVRTKIDMSFEDSIIELANSEAPSGKDRWSVRLLAKKAIELNWIGSVSHMTIHRLLKKRNFNLDGDESRV